MASDILRILPWTDDFPKDLPVYDNSKLVAVNTCPLWGIMRYGKHKTMGNIGRALALEAGQLIHECAAAVRMAELIAYGDKLYTDRREEASTVLGVDLPDYDTMCDILHQHMGGQFDSVRYEEIRECLPTRKCSDAEFVRSCAELVSVVIDTSSYYDDPFDRNRTLANIEGSAHEFVYRFTPGLSIPLVIRDTQFVGIEQGFNHTIWFGDEPFCRFVGRIDSIEVRLRDLSLLITDYKTASNMSDAWEMAHETSHQFTGYMLAASVLLGYDIPIRQGKIVGIRLPQPKTAQTLGIRNVPISRKQSDYLDWSSWLRHTDTVYRMYEGNVAEAPKYTHSCSRYFRPCPLIPYCTSTHDERQQMFEELTHDEWSPLAEA